MSDGELITLTEDFRDLNDVARWVLCDEMRKRNLGDSHCHGASEPDPQIVATATNQTKSTGLDSGNLSGKASLVIATTAKKPGKFSKSLAVPYRELARKLADYTPLHTKYRPPMPPRCGAPNPILEAVAPTNSGDVKCAGGSGRTL